MARSKRETLKFIRIRVRPAHLSNDAVEATSISGYVNTYKEFRKYDVEYEQGFVGSFTTRQEQDFFYLDISGKRKLNPAPQAFFVGNTSFSRLGVIVSGVGVDVDEYQNLAFILKDVHVPYDRRNPDHDLDVHRADVYLLRIEGNFGNIENKDDIRTRAELNIDPPALTFRVNPLNIQIQKKKLFKKLRTRAGWVFQHWGPEIGQIQIRGTSGRLIPDPEIILATKKLPLIGSVPLISTFNDERPTEDNSPALFALRELEKWYDEDQSEQAVEKGFLTALEYRGRIYVGHLASFQLIEKGDQPHQLFYNIVFVVHYDAGNLQAATSRAVGQIVRNDKTLAEVRRLKGANE